MERHNSAEKPTNHQYFGLCFEEPVHHRLAAFYCISIRRLGPGNLLEKCKRRCRERGKRQRRGSAMLDGCPGQWSKRRRVIRLAGRRRPLGLAVFLVLTRLPVGGALAKGGMPPAADGGSEQLLSTPSTAQT